jgi:hypothetical protein
MKYINTQTGVIKMHFKLIQEVNPDIIPGEVFGDWHPVHETEIPGAPEGYHVEVGPVILDPESGLYYQTYVAVEDTANPTPVPYAIDSFQGKAILITDGLYSIVETFIMNPEVPDIYRAAWDSAKMWERDSVFVNNMLQMLGKTSEEGDEMFIRASVISLNSLANQ